MPNHVYTTMSIEGTPEEVQNFFITHFIDDDGGNAHFDFETFIKMPDELHGTTYPIQYGRDWTDEQKRDYYENNVRMREEYGADNWYDWCLQNWGTKWNAYDTLFSESVINTVSFQTAWSLPAPIFEKMAELYPTLTFHIQTVEEGGYFAGTITISNGEVESNLTDDDALWKQYAYELMGWEFDEDE